MSGVGRNDSPASGSFREANLQRRLSGGESEELSVATRPKPDAERLPGADVTSHETHLSPSARLWLSAFVGAGHLRRG